MPIGAHAAIGGDTITLTAIVTSLDGTQAVRSTISAAAAGPEAAGDRAAAELLAGGAQAILDAVERDQAAVEGLQP
jgi:hydroxymethylbilane synthase